MISDLEWSAQSCLITLLVSSIYLWNINYLAYNESTSGKEKINKFREETSINVYDIDYINGPSSVFRLFICVC